MFRVSYVLDNGLVDKVDIETEVDANLYFDAAVKRPDCLFASVLEFAQGADRDPAWVIVNRYARDVSWLIN